MRGLVIALALAGTTLMAQAPAKPGIVTGAEARKVVPTTFFFHGQLAPTQERNSAAVRLEDGRVWMAALVDTSGYASNIVERVQGFLISEKALQIGGKELAPGVYAIGSDEQGNFIVQDLGRKDALIAPTERDTEMKAPRPLQIQARGEGWRLYLGRRFVEVAAR